MAGFVMEKKFYFVLSHSLIEQQADKTAILKLLQTGTKWKEAITYYLNHQVKNKQYDLLFELIDEPAVDKEILSKPLAQAIITQDIQKVLDGLLQNPTKRDWQILGMSIRYIENAAKIEKVREIAELVFEKAIVFEPYPIRIGVVLFDYLKIKHRNEHKEKLKHFDLGERNIDNYSNYLNAAVHVDNETALAYYDICEEILLKEDNREYDLALVYLNKGNRYMQINQEGYKEIEAREKSLKYLKKAENILKNNIADNCNNIIFIYLNYCWIHSKKIIVDDKWLDNDLMKVQFYLDSSYELYQRYFGNEKELLKKIFITEAHCIKYSNPEKAVELWKKIVAINIDLYQKFAVNDKYFAEISRASNKRNEAFKYYRSYQKEFRKTIYNSKSILLFRDYCMYTQYFYWMRRFFIRGFFYAIIFYTLKFSIELGKKYYLFLIPPFLFLVIVFSPLIYLFTPIEHTYWKKNKWINF